MKVVKSRKEVFIVWATCAKILKSIHRILKWSNVICNLIIFAIASLIIIRDVIISESYSLLLSEEGVHILRSILLFSVLNTWFLIKNNSREINKIIPQNLIYSLALLNVMSSYISGHLHINFINSVATEIIVFWGIIFPYLGNFKNRIKQAHFLKLFVVNLVIACYSIIFEYTDNSFTPSITFWLLMLAGSTYWQLYYLDTNDNFPLIGESLSDISRFIRKNHRDNFFR